MSRPRSVASGLFAAVTLVAVAGPAAHAVRADPPKPLPGPLAVDLRYQDVDKLQDVVLGPMAIEPAEGSSQTYMKVTASGACPRGTNTVTRIYGPKLPAEGQNMIGNNYIYDFGVPPGSRMTSPLTITLQEVVERQATPVTLDGVYRIWMQCQNADMDDFSINFGVFEAKLRIKNGAYTALTTGADLPAKPSPKIGPEGHAAWAAKQNAPAQPTPQVDPAVLEAEQAAATTSETSDSNAGLALGAVAAVVALGLVPTLLLHRRNKATTGK